MTVPNAGTLEAAAPAPSTGDLESPVQDRHARRCGRCRTWFAADYEADRVARAEWWLCAACRVKLLGRPDDAVG